MITLLRSPTSRVGPAGSIPWHDESALDLALIGCGRGSPQLLGSLRDRGVRARAHTLGPGLLRSLDEAGPEALLVGPEISDPPALVQELNGGLWSLLFLSRHADPELAARMIEAGADDVLPPPHSATAILFRLRVVRARTVSGSPSHGGSPRFGAMEADLEGRRLLNGSRPVPLSRREYELLARLLQADGEVVTREALLCDIWGEDQDSEGVLDATVHRLRRKLESDVAEPRFLTTVRGVGYRLEPSG